MITHCQPVRILSRSPSRAIRAALTAVLVLAALAPPAHAQDTPLLEGSVSAQNYILQLSGTVLNERFNGATMTLQLRHSRPRRSEPLPGDCRGLSGSTDAQRFFLEFRFRHHGGKLKYDHVQNQAGLAEPEYLFLLYQSGGD